MNSRIIIHTQIFENYGSQEKPFMKFKFGEEYSVPYIEGHDHLANIVSAAYRHVTDMHSDVGQHGYNEFPIGYEILPANELTEREKDYIEMGMTPTTTKLTHAQIGYKS